MKFLEDIFMAAKNSGSVNSPALDSLVSLISDTFMGGDHFSLESAFQALTVSQHAGLMAL
ncbi:hypothetical protein MKX03_004391, partial [Papaver bracteatum]